VGLIQLGIEKLCVGLIVLGTHGLFLVPILAGASSELKAKNVD
jgi:signal transduction histidine kinase